MTAWQRRSLANGQGTFQGQRPGKLSCADARAGSRGSVISEGTRDPASRLGRHARVRGPSLPVKGGMAAAWALVLALIATLAWSAVARAAPIATITGSFSDSCRDFAAHSSKDVSHVVIHHADGRVVKDEDINSPDFLVEGGAGDEIDFAIVESGTTTEQFACARPPTDSAPTGVLERKVGSSDHQNPEGSWTSADCQYAPDTTFCAYGLGVGESSVSFRGTGSTEPDDDIASWSIDFADGTSAGTGAQIHRRRSPTTTGSTRVPAPWS